MGGKTRGGENVLRKFAKFAGPNTLRKKQVWSQGREKRGENRRKRKKKETWDVDQKETVWWEVEDYQGREKKFMKGGKRGHTKGGGGIPTGLTGDRNREVGERRAEDAEVRGKLNLRKLQKKRKREKKNKGVESSNCIQKFGGGEKNEKGEKREKKIPGGGKLVGGGGERHRKRTAERRTEGKWQNLKRPPNRFGRGGTGGFSAIEAAKWGKKKVHL